MQQILYKELSYKLVGVLYKVHQELGNRYQEKYYQRAIAIELKKQNIPYREQVMADLVYAGENIGKYYLDFLINNVIILEIKAAPRLLPKDFQQVKAYLELHKLQLGILVNFRSESIRPKRILNLY